MASSRRVGFGDHNLGISDAGRELFEACRNGDLTKVKKLVNGHNVNAKDTAGRKSSPLHFAAGSQTSSASRFNYQCLFDPSRKVTKKKRRLGQFTIGSTLS